MYDLITPAVGILNKSKHFKSTIWYLDGFIPCWSKKQALCTNRELWGCPMRKVETDRILKYFICLTKQGVEYRENFPNYYEW